MNKNMIKLEDSNDRGVSHITGIALLMSLILVIGAIVLAAGTGLLGGITASADASVSFQEVDTEGDGEADAVEVQLRSVADDIEHIQIDVMSVDGEDGEIQIDDPIAGDSVIVPDEDSNEILETGDRVNVVAYSSDADEVVGSFQLPPPSEQRGVQAVADDESGGTVGGNLGVS